MVELFGAEVALPWNSPSFHPQGLALPEAHSSCVLPSTRCDRLSSSLSSRSRALTNEAHCVRVVVVGEVPHKLVLAPGRIERDPLCFLTPRGHRAVVPAQEE